ncbi:MAG: metal ABC transporter solute-binding protein, Zn/Mn family [Desulfomonilaceae bacterium]
MTGERFGRCGWAAGSRIVTSIIACSVFLMACMPVWAEGQPEKSPAVRCFVSILPQEFFVSKIGGPHVIVDVLVGPGQEPHTFELTPKAMASLAQADLFFTLGLPFERVILKKLAGAKHKVKIIDTTRGVTFLEFREEHAHDHHHDAHEGHVKDSARDPHIWLDPSLVKIQAANIAQALAAQDPAHAHDYQANLSAFQAELDELDAELAATLKPFKGQKFYVYHPAFGYFAARYGLLQVPVEMGGKEPTARHIAGLIKSAKENGVRIIFVEPQFSTKGAEMIAKAIGGTIIPIDPLSKDYLNNMRAIAAAIRGAMLRTGDAPAK